MCSTKIYLITTKLLQLMQTNKFFAIIFASTLGTLIFLNSCNKPSESSNDTVLPATTATATALQVKNGRLAFKDSEQFWNQVITLSKLSSEEASKWESNYTYKSLRKELDDYNQKEERNDILADLNAFNFPQGLSAILNENGECVIGDSLVWYNNGKKHFIPNLDEAALSTIKQNPSQSQIFNFAGSKIEHQTPLDIRTVCMGINALDARHQMAFTQRAPAAGSRKFVHEIVSFTEYGRACISSGCTPYSIKSTLTLRIKMEWKGSGGWKPAGERRDISWNVNGTISLPNLNDPFGNPLNINSPFNQTGNEQVTGNRNVLLFNFTGVSSNPPTSLCATVNGSIIQHVTGDIAANTFNNSGFPLW
jgi:hypothetical protein